MYLTMKIEFLISHSINLCLKSLSDQVRRCFGLLFISNLGACDLLFLSKGRSVSLTSQLFQQKCVLLSLENIYKLYYDFVNRMLEIIYLTKSEGDLVCYLPQI